MFEFATEFPLVPDENKFYLGIAHNGHQTYLSSGNRQISILDDHCSLIKQVHTYRSFHTICYDYVLKCFWAASTDRPGVLLCLSEHLEELDPIDLISEPPNPIDIDHLFYDTNGRQLYLTSKNQVYAVDQKGHLKTRFEIQGDTEALEGICAYNSYFLCLLNQKEERRLSVFASNGTLLEERNLSADFKVCSMTLMQNPLNPLTLCLRLLVIKQRNTPFLMDYKPSLSFFTLYSVANLTNTNQSSPASDIRMQQLCGNRRPSPFVTPGCKECNHNGSHSGFQNSGCPIPSTNNCSNGCKYCCPDSPDNCQTDYCCCQSFSDVIESIALTEASIAHILNAEGEKLQKAIACSRNVCELLKVNDSVLKTIIHSTQLEQMLYYKLESILNADCHGCHLPPPPCCHQHLPREGCSEPHCE